MVNVESWSTLFVSMYCWAPALKLRLADEPVRLRRAVILCFLRCHSRGVGELVSALAEVPDAMVSVAPDAFGVLAVEDLVAAVVHPDRGERAPVLGQRRYPDPDDRGASLVPALDLVVEHVVLVVGEAEVLPLILRLPVVDPVLVQEHQNREVAQRGLDAAVEIELAAPRPHRAARSGGGAARGGRGLCTSRAACARRAAARGPRRAARARAGRCGLAAARARHPLQIERARGACSEREDHRGQQTFHRASLQARRRARRGRSHSFGPSL